LFKIFFYLGGGIYFSNSTGPILLECIFSRNTATESGYGNDICFNSDNLVFSVSLYGSSCSASPSPQISSNNYSNVLNFSYHCPASEADNCFFSPYCSFIENRIDCNNENVSVVSTDAPCMWSLADESEGICKSYNDVGCRDFELDSLCINNNIFISDGDCYFDMNVVSDFKCKKYFSTSSCVNSEDFIILERNCTLKDCPYRSLNTLSGFLFPCRTSNCFVDIDGLTCTDSCSNTAHYIEDISSGTCKLKSCSIRNLNISTESLFPCGTSDCFVDIDGLTCTDSCSNTMEYIEDISSGTCKFILCSDRVGNIDSSTACGSTNCYLVDVTSLECTSDCSLKGRLFSSAYIIIIIIFLYFIILKFY
jgi:hypothetical protein